jgi:hypothetical protein
MAQNSQSEPRTKGNFVVGFITCVSEVSPVFGGKLRKILENNGIEEPQEGESYSMDAVVASINQVSEEVGEQTTHQIGIHQVTIPEWPEEVDTVEKGFQALQEMYVGAYENFNPELLGKFTFEKTGERQGRAAVTAEFPYPSSFASGIFEGTIKEFSARDARPELSETNAKPGEKVAYELNW